MEREEEKSEQASRSNKQEEVALSSKRVRKMPNYLSDYVLTAQTSSPSSFHEAMQSVDAADWRKADILTKALPKTRFQNLRRQLGIVSEHMNC
ncbi:hypothetical protein T06_9176 [Trichinella sp. T6]|nr:hypothetical protein T06_9176 [Trichinella sp. T6]